ncbi:hypothetical protein FKM82_017480 [Ascaphus truei]
MSTARSRCVGNDTSCSEVWPHPSLRWGTPDRARPGRERRLPTPRSYFRGSGVCRGPFRLDRHSVLFSRPFSHVQLLEAVSLRFCKIRSVLSKKPPTPIFFRATSRCRRGRYRELRPEPAMWVWLRERNASVSLGDGVGCSGHSASKSCTVQPMRLVTCYSRGVTPGSCVAGAP